MLLSVMYVYSMVYTINYVLHGLTMGTVKKICLVLLLLLIGIYDCVGMYNEAVVTDWCVDDDDNDDVELWQPYAHPFPKG